MNSPTAQLRPTTPDDLDFVLPAEAAAHAAGYVRLWTRDRHLQTLADANEGHWIIEDATTRDRVGYVILLGLQDPDQCLLLKRIVITQTGQGYGREVLMQVLDKAFNEFAAHRVWLDVMEENHRARSLYRSLGFVEEGRLRESVKLGEQFASMWLMSMLRSEFLARS
ncbi:GNAT family N-acetyltransferase [Leptolyngbya iicbica]|uniref:N-acetyltransferase n=2 Tax=Cyanophyceae TaxID=3028117 RepID=A0A4Q7E5I7_9CYAN|nr:GNAT family protein [Leptolyngbya sp. LK]RZM77417.1 N-acetyltransferase [Leptolyngbya sp. LK]